MKHEIECKIRLNAPLDENIDSLGAQYHGKVHEKNWVFEKAGELFESGQLLRLRVTDDNCWGIVTHKALAQGEGVYKKRIETEVRVDNADNLRRIFTSLGYREDWFYEKFRQSWVLDRCEIVIDTMPELGQFIEIEADSEDEISAIINNLGLDINDNTKSSYRQIWREYCLSQGRDFCDWRFL